MGRPIPISQLARRMDGYADAVEENTGSLLSEIAKRVGAHLVPDTPVRTGRARGNWVPTLNAPAGGPYNDHFDPKATDTPQWIASVADKAGPDDSIYITNRVTYIGQLNRGHSSQATPFFVQAAVNRGFDEAVKQSRGKFLEDNGVGD